ncbi:MAG: hypothetical protein AAGD38_05660 [Acidobacteriota bacterium]
MSTDPRMLEVLRLLREMAASPAATSPVPGGGAGEAVAWSSPTDDVAARRRAEQLLTSATDLLVPWSPDHGTPDGWRGAPAWDRYFDPVTTPAPTSPAPATGFTTPTAPPTDDLIVVPPAVLETPGPDDELADRDAAEVIDTLFDFIDAVSRHAIDDAMGWVADSYHVIVDDREIDKDGLRIELTRFLEPRVDGELDIRLSRVPEPVPHPLGVLVLAPLRIDFTPRDGTPEPTLLDTRLALFCREDDAWRLASLASAPEPSR